MPEPGGHGGEKHRDEAESHKVINRLKSSIANFKKSSATIVEELSRLRKYVSDRFDYEAYARGELDPALRKARMTDEKWIKRITGLKHTIQETWAAKMERGIHSVDTKRIPDEERREAEELQVRLINMRNAITGYRFTPVDAITEMHIDELVQILKILERL